MAKRLPKYPTKKDSQGRARIKFLGRVYYLPGAIGSPESMREYARLIAEFAAGTAPRINPANKLTIDELIARYVAADPRGEKHPQVQRVARACEPLSRLFGPTHAEDFTAGRLKAIQAAMITGSWMTPEEKGEPWCRSYIAQQIEKIRKVFRWAETEGLVSEGKWEHLRTLQIVRAGTPGVRTTKPRTACDWQTQVVPTLPFLPPAVAAMVRLQLLLGARPGEILCLSRSQIDRTSRPDVWLYRPARHKNTHRGQSLVKIIGDEAKAILAPWLLACPADDAPLFRPSSRDLRPYGSDGYAAAIRRACAAAGVVPWTLYQVRHLSKRLAARGLDTEHARAFLGQESLAATMGYDRGQDIDAAIKAARVVEEQYRKTG